MRQALKLTILRLLDHPDFKSAEAIGERLGITGDAVNKIKNGHNDPRWRVGARLARLASSLGIDDLIHAMSPRGKRMLPVPLSFVPNLSTVEEALGVFDSAGRARHRQQLFSLTEAKLEVTTLILRAQEWYLELEAIERAYGVPSGDGLPQSISDGASTTLTDLNSTTKPSTSTRKRNAKTSTPTRNQKDEN